MALLPSSGKFRILQSLPCRDFRMCGPQTGSIYWTQQIRYQTYCTYPYDGIRSSLRNLTSFWKRDYKEPKSGCPVIKEECCTTEINRMKINCHHHKGHHHPLHRRRRRDPSFIIIITTIATNIIVIIIIYKVLLPDPFLLRFHCHWSCFFDALPRCFVCPYLWFSNYCGNRNDN
jgi:hypothetical protein